MWDILFIVSCVILLKRTPLEINSLCFVSINTILVLQTFVLDEQLLYGIGPFIFGPNG